MFCYLFKPNEKKNHNWIGYETKQSQQTEINTAKYKDLEYFLAPTMSPRSQNVCLSVVRQGFVYSTQPFFQQSIYHSESAVSQRTVSH